MISCSSQLQGLYPQKDNLGEILSLEQKKMAYPQVNITDENINKALIELGNSSLPNLMILTPVRMVGDRSICVNNIINNFREYYSEPGPAYYPCDTHFPYCLYCQNKNTCDDCKNNYIFLRGEKNECFSFEEDKTYIENGNYYPCYDAFPLCDLCKSKGSCYKCLKDYYLIYVRSKNFEKLVKPLLK